MFELIEFKNVTFKYGQTAILKDINLKIFPKEFIHVIGPNGGGKTTFLKLLMGFLKPTSGHVLIENNSPEKVQQRLAYVPQVFNFDKLFPISVLEVVLSGRLSKLPWHGRYSQKDRQDALLALKQVGLEHLHHQPVGELSGGQMQRTLIARALASKPQILLLDEPTSCLDLNTQTEIDRILKELQKEMTILMVTHDLDHLGKNAHRVLSIHGSLHEIQPGDVCQHMSMGLYHPAKTKEPV